MASASATQDTPCVACCVGPWTRQPPGLPGVGSAPAAVSDCYLAFTTSLQKQGRAGKAAESEVMVDRPADLAKAGKALLQEATEAQGRPEWCPL